MANNTYGLKYEASADLDIFESYASKQSRPRKSDIRRIRRALRKLQNGASHWHGASR